MAVDNDPLNGGCLTVADIPRSVSGILSMRWADFLARCASPPGRCDRECDEHNERYGKYGYFNSCDVDFHLLLLCYLPLSVRTLQVAVAISISGTGDLGQRTCQEVANGHARIYADSRGIDG